MDPVEDPLPAESSVPTRPDAAPLPPPANPARYTPEETAALLASWQISPEEHQSILHTKILPVELHPFLPSSNDASSSSLPARRPLAVLILGQTGAGKTRLAPVLFDALQQGPLPLPPSPSPSPSPAPAPAPAVPKTKPLHLIADTYKTHHPHYTTALSTLPQHASGLASTAAALWLAQVCAHAARAGADVLVETACRRRSDFQALLQTFRGAGYAVRVAVLAVPAALSRLGILVRYWRRLPEAGSRGLPVRLTPRGVHDESFAGLGLVIRGLEGRFGGGGDGNVEQGVNGGAVVGGDGDGDEDEDGDGNEKGDNRGGAVDRVVVVRRNGAVVYANERVTGDDGREKWKVEAGALRALEAERARGLSGEERRAAEEDMQMLRGLGDPKVDKELEEIEELLAELGVGEVVSPDVVPFDAHDFVWKGVGG